MTTQHSVAWQCCTVSTGRGVLAASMQCQWRRSGGGCVEMGACGLVTQRGGLRWGRALTVTAAGSQGRQGRNNATHDDGYTPHTHAKTRARWVTAVQAARCRVTRSLHYCEFAAAQRCLELIATCNTLQNGVARTQTAARPCQYGNSKMTQQRTASTTLLTLGTSHLGQALITRNAGPAATPA